MFSWVRLSDLTQWTGAKVVHPSSENRPVVRICTDSRTLQAGDVFLALKGESFDGHDFVEEAARRGASALVSERLVEGTPCLLVSDTLEALVKIGQGLRSRFSGNVLAVTGSAGKSSTKEMTAALLGQNAVAAPASFNNLIGVSKTLFLLEDSTRSLVLEMGMNAAGEIRQLCERFRPDFGLITNIGDAHMGKLGGREEVYRAKKELFDFLSSGPAKGVALNLDDSRVVRAYREAFSKPPRTISYSPKGQEADVSVSSRAINPENGFMTLQILIRGRAFGFSLPIFGLHHSENIAAAVSAALLLETPVDELVSRVSNIRPARHRGEVCELSDGVVLIDESYNSNPTALRSSLESLYKLADTRRRVLILGDMFELGDFSEKFHREAGEGLARLQSGSKVGLVLVGVGQWMPVLIKAVQERLSGVSCYHASDAGAAAKIALSMLKSNDLILVKGSRGNALDKTVEALRNNYAPR